MTCNGRRAGLILQSDVKNCRSSARGPAITEVAELFSAVVDAGYMIAIGTSARAPATIYLATEYVDDARILQQRGHLPCSDNRGTIGGCCRSAPNTRDASCVCDQHCEENDPHFPPSREEAVGITHQSHGTITITSRSSTSPGRTAPAYYRSDFGRDHGAKMR